MENNLKEIVSKALLVSKDSYSKEVRHVLKTLEEVMIKNKDLLIEASEIDVKNGNGFLIDFSIVSKIFENVEKDTAYFGDVILAKNDEEKKMLYGKEIMDQGVVSVIYDGDFYVLLEMILRNLKAGNSLILLQNSYMMGANQLLVQICQDVLESLCLSRNFIQLFLTDNYEEIFPFSMNIDLVIAIGDRILQNNVLTKSPVKTITSGYNNFDLYIEDLTHIDFLKEIINTNHPLQVYVQKDLDFSTSESIIVDDIDEAIGQIQYTGNRYSVAIFTKDDHHASRFMREVKSKYVVVNTNPMIEQILDIKQEDLVLEKTLIYPFSIEKSKK